MIGDVNKNDNDIEARIAKEHDDFKILDTAMDGTNLVVSVIPRGIESLDDYVPSRSHVTLMGGGHSISKAF